MSLPGLAAPKTARVLGFAILFGLALLFGLRVVWLVDHFRELRPVGGGDEAPAFRLPLLGGGEFEHAPGAAVTVIDFWATWCGPCREELPHVDALYRRYHDRGVRVVAVDAETAEARPAVERLAAQMNLVLPLALDGADIAGRYRVSSLPHLVIIGKDGTIARVLLGVREDSELDSAVDAALAR